MVSKRIPLSISTSLIAKKKGSGVALYIHNSLNATIDDKLSQVTENLETLFVTISGDNPTTIGTLYRPPNGNLEKALDVYQNAMYIKMP